LGKGIPKYLSGLIRVNKHLKVLKSVESLIGIDLEIELNEKNNFA